jgi:nitrogen fixation protein FixH
MFRRCTPAARWYPEDAVVQVWKHPAHNKDALVEMSLRENGMRTRAEQLPDGEWAFFVSPADETAAREILRQVVEGTPPA